MIAGRKVSAFGRAVGGDDDRPAEPDVVLQRHFGAVDLTPVGGATQLPRELAALREPGGASGCPFEMRPPDGLTTQRPPYVVSSASTSLPPSPSAHSPSASYVSSSLVEKQSWSR